VMRPLLPSMRPGTYEGRNSPASRMTKLSFAGH
jgi:hypothetical protein